MLDLFPRVLVALPLRTLLDLELLISREVLPPRVFALILLRLFAVVALLELLPRLVATASLPDLRSGR